MISKAFLSMMLVLGLLLLSGAQAAERIERSTDQGIIHISNVPARGKVEEDKADKPASEVKGRNEATEPTPAPLGLLPTHSRRTRMTPGEEVIPRPPGPLLKPAATTPSALSPGVPAPAAPAAATGNPPAPKAQ